MDDETNNLFKRVAGKLGWVGPGRLDSAEKELVRCIGKGRHPLTGGPNAGPASTVPLELSDSDSSGKENWRGNGECRQNRVRLDSSNNNVDYILAEKATPTPAAQRSLSRPLSNSPPVQLVSSGSDTSFEEFLSKVKTPKSKPMAAVRNSSDDSLTHFIVDSFSSDDDFAELMKKPTPKSKPKTPKSLQVPRSVVGRPPSQWESPIFHSDSDSDNDGVVIRSTWKSRHTPRGPCSAGQEDGAQARVHLASASNLAPAPSSRTPSPYFLPPPPPSSCSSVPLKLTHRAPPPADDSTSSEDEFLSLLERLKRNHSVGSNSTQRPSPEPEQKPCLSVPSGLGRGRTGPSKVEKGSRVGSNSTQRPSPEPEQKPCLSVPSGLGRGRTGPSKVEKGSRIDGTPVQPPRSQPHVSLTEPRPATGSRVGVCKTPGCFLQSLSTPGSLYNRSFKQNKEELTSRLYKMYNTSVFDCKLPSDMSVSWNKKLRKTAGYCITGQERGGGNRYARIELSEKVCDSADRLRDTLVHEMCHAATWLINGVRDGHGSFWKLYARKATLAHPELPMVTRCHSYDINYKYQYQCSRCKNTIGRHSKSLDTQRFVCALCTGQLVLLTPAKPRSATPFANFVKENYKTARQAPGVQSHAEVMRKLSADFASMTRLSQS